MSDDKTTNFIREIIEEDLRAEKHREIVTRFPPEPNGYLHIGHAKAICISFGIAEDFHGRCHLRFDDTNPAKEEQMYIDAMKRDIRWLGFEWGNHEYHASDYFEQLYEWAAHLICEEKAYVDDQTAEQIRATRGTVTAPGIDSPWRDRPTEESLALFDQMKNGAFKEGERVLRARIDMASPNMNLRDPVLYRIVHATHPRTGDKWHIYPMYDFAHGQSDAIEHITHSLCSLEFEDHRPLYDWFIENLPVPSTPRQIEFARLNLSYTIVSKRVLRTLVEDNHVSGWDDPRMPTLSAMRRRGVPPKSIRSFCDAIGVTKFNSLTDITVFENEVRSVLNKTSHRVMGVLNPLRVVIENYPEDQEELLDAMNHPEDESAGSRTIPFSRELYIERDDFMEDPPRKFFRLGPGREVRLRYAFFVTCTETIKDSEGNVVELRCNYDPETRGGDAPDGRKVKGTLHWVSARHAVQAEVLLYDRLFSVENPGKSEEGKTFIDYLNPDSLRVIHNAFVEPSVKDKSPGDRMQFERIGYFCVDQDATPDKLIINRTVPLRDSWAKKQKK